MVKRAIITIAAVLLIPWLLWGALITGGWALMLIVPAVALYWILTKEFYSKKGDGRFFRMTQDKDTHYRTIEKERPVDAPHQTKRYFKRKHGHPVGAGTTFEPR
ncbi:MAG: hypothetical protein V4736_03410 [Bdellovibrionota bacterium]